MFAMALQGTPAFNGQPLPGGERLIYARSRPLCPERPIIPFIEGDGAGSSIWRACRRVLDSAVYKAYENSRSISWYEIFGGHNARERFSEWFPDDSVEAVRYCGVCLIGPLFEPVGTGIRNRLQKTVDLSCRIRPVQSIEGWPGGANLSAAANALLVSESNSWQTSHLEFDPDTAESEGLSVLLKQFGYVLPESPSFSMGSVSKIQIASLMNQCMSICKSSKFQRITIVHRGLRGRSADTWFKDWSYRYLEEHYRPSIVNEKRLESEFSGTLPAGMILVRDLGLDDLLLEFVDKTEQHQVIAARVPLADHLSSFLCSQTGTLKIAPTALIGDNCAVFANSPLSVFSREQQDLANPISLILAGAMLLNFIGWNQAADLVSFGLSKALEKRLVTFDLEHLFKGATKIKTSDFATVIIDNIVKL